MLADGLQEASVLLSQAADAGLLAAGEPPAGMPEAIALLSQVRTAAVPRAPLQPPGEEFDRLQTERATLIDQLRLLRERRALANALAKGGSELEDESVEQVVRLQPIGLVPSPDQPSECPLCGEPLASPPAAVSELRSALEDVERQIHAVERERPGLVDVQDEIRTREAGVRRLLEANREALDRLAQNAETVAEHAQRLDLGAYVRGRIDEYLEKAPVLSDDQATALTSAEASLR